MLCAGVEMGFALEMDLSSNNSVVRGIIFDFDNTLVDTKGAGVKALNEVRENLESRIRGQGDASGVISSFQSLLKMAEKDPDGITPIDEWRTNLWSQALGDAGSTNGLATETYDLWKESRLKGIVLTPEVKTLLLGLRSQYKLLLLTNGDSQVQREKLNRCDGWRYFDFVMISGDFSYEKPDPAIFEDALKKLQLEKNECIVVGDSLGPDIQGGADAGLRTVWVNPHVPDDIANIKPRPDHHITTVLQLNDVLGKLNRTKHP